MTLAPDDLEPDAFITIHSHHKKSTRQRREMCVEYDPEIGEDSLHDPAGNFGVPFQILALSLPYIICSQMVAGGDEVGPVIFDIRKVKLMRLDTSYVEAFMEYEPLGFTLGKDMDHRARKGA